MPFLSTYIDGRTVKFSRPLNPESCANPARTLRARRMQGRNWTPKSALAWGNLLPSPPASKRSGLRKIMENCASKMMSFLGENKLLFGAVGIALSSAALGFVISRGFERRNSFNAPFKVNSEHSPVAKYVLEYGIREPLPLMKLRQVRSLYYLNWQRTVLVSPAIAGIWLTHLNSIFKCL